MMLVVCVYMVVYHALDAMCAAFVRKVSNCQHQCMGKQHLHICSTHMCRFVLLICAYLLNI